jgi:hypothetical protein
MLFSRGLVFTTNAFTKLDEHTSRTHAANRNVRESPDSKTFENMLKQFSNHLGLRKLG